MPIIAKTVITSQIYVVKLRKHNLLPNDLKTIYTNRSTIKIKCRSFY